MDTAGLRWAPDTLPIDMMTALTILTGATTAAATICARAISSGAAGNSKQTRDPRDGTLDGPVPQPGLHMSVPYPGSITRQQETPVSYTHLTLPTNYSVSITVVAVSLKKKNNTILRYILNKQ